MGGTSSPTITVLTPTFNRAHTLPRLYESLVAQSFRDFEWLIVDDGSDDETESLVRGWMAAGDVEIEYRRQPTNRGMHVAVNQGVQAARGTFVSLVGSDDWWVDNALERLVHHWNAIPEAERPRFSGVIGLCMYEDGRLVGDRYPSDPLDCDPVELHYLYRVSGDKQGMLRRDVWRDFPFPFEDLRGYIQDALVWNRMALKYVERHVNEVYLVKHYSAGGLSDRMLELMIQAAPATRQFFLEEAKLPHKLTRRQRTRSNANYIRFSIHSRTGLRRQVREAPSRGAWAVLWPLGAALFLRDRWRMRALARRNR